MKTFKDLKFEPHPYAEEGKAAFIDFDNGRAVSVIRGAKYFHTSEERPFEVGFFTKDGKLGCIYLDRKCRAVALEEDADHKDVAGYCTEDEVTLIMKAIQIL